MIKKNAHAESPRRSNISQASPSSPKSKAVVTTRLKQIVLSTSRCPSHIALRKEAVLDNELLGLQDVLPASLEYVYVTWYVRHVADD